MAPAQSSKRSRREPTEAFEDEDELGDMRRQSNGKRVRLSAATEDEDSAMSDSSSATFANSSSNSAVPPRRQTAQKGRRGAPTPVELSEGGEEDSEEEEEVQEEEDDEEMASGSDSEDPEDELRATQLVHRKYQQQLGDNHAADNGIIEEVTMVNFMCHSRLTFKFGPLINFIIGHNGSGKSAVLTALQLCLGTKAGATNRGQSLKSFIKHGQDSASLSVRVKNQGANAYQPDVYGPSIIIERSFTANGGSGYKIKNSAGHIMSTKKSVLEDITDTFAHQFDNPMTVLTQDQSRQFLNSSSPNDKYKFFLLGTQLKQLDQDYRLFADNIEHIEQRIGPQEQDLSELHRRWKEAEKKEEDSRRAGSIRSQIANLSRQMAWVQVEEQESLLQEADEAIAQIDSSIEQATDEAENVGQGYEKLDELYEGAQALVQELRESIPTAEAKIQDVKETWNKNVGDLSNLLGQERQIRGEVKAAKTNVNSLEKRIEEERQKQAAANGGAHAVKLAEIQEAKEVAQDAKQKQEEHTGLYRGLERQEFEAKAKLDRAKPALENKRDEIRSLDNKIHHMRQSQGQWMDAYNKNLPNLLKAIEREKGFRERPVGPLGRHVRLLHSKWASVLERAFGGALNAFAVTSKHDQGLLQALMSRSQCVYPVLIGDSTPIDTSRNEPDARLLTWLRALKIDNDLARNQFIINQGIDQTVLIDNKNDAVEFMTADTRPRNVKQTFAIHGSGGLRFGWLTGGGDTSSPLAPWKEADRMQADVESRLNTEKENLANQKRELDQLEKQYRELGNAVQKCREALERHRREQKALRLETQLAEDTATRLQDELEEETPQTGLLEALEGQLEEARDAVETHKMAYQDCAEARQALDAKQKELKPKVENAQNELDEIKAKIDKANNKVVKTRDRREQALRQKNEAYAKIDDLKNQKGEAEEERETVKSRVEEYTRLATELCSRIPVEPGVTWTILEKRLERLDAQQRVVEQQLGGTLPELTKRNLEAKEAYESAGNNLKRQKDLAVAMKRGLVYRRDRWNKFRKYITTRAKGTFTYLLSERAFRGRLDINHTTHTLDIRVEPDITKKSAAGRESKTLSGGEKSFCTICVLLALWEAMGAPIRCLDEFDVFMDNVNRDVSMTMMIQAARRSVSKQFILITPQAMGRVSMGPDVKINKLDDPARGQTTLPFAPQAAA